MRTATLTWRWCVGRACAAVVVLLAAFLAPQTARAATVSEFVCCNAPANPVAVGDGSLWITDATTDADEVVHLTAEDEVGRFPLATVDDHVRGGMTEGPDGNLWLGVQRGAPATATFIARMTRSGGVIDIPVPSNGDIGGITRGPDGNVWFTEPDTDRIGRVTPDGLLTEFAGLAAGSAPQAITAASDGNLYVLTTAGVARVSRAGIVTPVGGPLGTALVDGPGGALWISDTAAVRRVSYGGTVTATYPMPALTSLTGLAVGRDGALWLAQWGPNGVARLRTDGSWKSFTGTIAGHGGPDGVAAAADGAIWFTDSREHAVGRVLLDAPSALTGLGRDIAERAATLTASVEDGDAPATVRFDYGPTSAYGSHTADAPWRTREVSVPLDGLTAGTMYHYRVVATSALGTAYGEDRSLTTTTQPPPVDPPIAVVDADGDGYPADVDCDDRRGDVHPGATDPPGDHVDQDCSGADAAYRRFSPRADMESDTVARGQASVFTRLRVSGLPAGTSVVLTCRGRSCPVARFATRLRGATRRVDLLRPVRRARLRRGTVVEVRLTHAGYLGVVLRWTIGPPPHLTTSCLTPGSVRTKRC